MAVAWVKTAGPAIQDINYGANSATFSGASIGSAAADRIVVVMVGSSHRWITGVTVGGNAATLIAQQRTGSDPNGQDASMWAVALASGTTADVVVTSSSALKFIGITVGKMVGASITPTDTDVPAVGANPDPQRMTLTVPTDGIGLAVLACTTPGTASWSGGTLDYELTSGSDYEITTGYSTASGNIDISGYAYASPLMVAAAFGPSGGSPSASVSPSPSPSIAPQDGIAWGEETPDAGEEAVTWQRWRVAGGAPIDVSGDQNWGAAMVASGTPCLGEVIDTGDTASKTFTVTRDKYETGSGAVTISIRGSASPFAYDAGSPSWSTYSGQVTQSWRYVQLKMES